jgi:ABC-type antimicrobial peptide transport system permease subunit
MVIAEVALALMLLVGVVAASLPAARAARIDPAGTLRS